MRNNNDNNVSGFFSLNFVCSLNEFSPSLRLSKDVQSSLMYTLNNYFQKLS